MYLLGEDKFKNAIKTNILSKNIIIDLMYLTLKN